MSICLPQLNHRLEFPSPHQALEQPNGLLAYGGDLSPARILLAYHQGIFPWYSPGEPILWWSPAPRMVLYPEKLYVGRSLSKILKKPNYSVWINRDFSAVIQACAHASRPGQQGTWISPQMIEAYTRLHELGWAHSFESWRNGRLAGGGYGILLGGMFFGESMFSYVSDASKCAFVHWVRFLQQLGVGCIDCQMHTDHLSRFGAEFISRDEFLSTVKALSQKQLFLNKWTDCIHHEPT
jgi:leucyl/phenylalanyl-tRNA--protein transferase